MKKNIYQKPDAWIVQQFEEVMINPADGSWRVTGRPSGEDDGWFSVIDVENWDGDFKGANDSFFDD